MSEVFLDNRENPQSGRQHRFETRDPLEDFYAYLLGERSLAGAASSRFNLVEARRSGKPLQRLWQAVEISAHDLADEVRASSICRGFHLPS